MNVDIGDVVPRMLKGYKQDIDFLKKHFVFDKNGIDIISLDGMSYDIGWDCLDSYEKLVGWLGHLMTKDWFMEDKRYIVFFVSRVEDFIKNGMKNF